MTNENEKFIQARNLYIQSDLTQAQIAAIVGVSQKTISQYISDNRWKLLKERANQVPAIALEQMNCELEDLNELIASRPKGSRHATLHEAEIRRKIMASMETVKDRQSAGTHIEVICNLLTLISAENIEHARILSRYTDKYVSGMLHSPFYDSYVLPGDTSQPSPTAEP